MQVWSSQAKTQIFFAKLAKVGPIPYRGSNPSLGAAKKDLILC